MFHLCFSDACCNCAYLDVCFTHMLHVLFGYCVWVAMVFKYVSGVFFKCFISMFQVFQLPLDICCNRLYFECFKSRSSVASLLLPLSAASSLPERAGHPYE
jgi:hypothetical protein